MAKAGPPEFSADRLTTATLSFVILWVVVGLIQCGLVARIVSNQSQSPRRHIFATLLGGIVCLIIAYGFRIGQIVIDHSNSALHGDEIAWISFYSINILAKTGYFLLLYLSIFFATYHRVTFYFGSSSRMWHGKKIVDSLILGTWVILFITKIGWKIGTYVGFYIDGTITSSENYVRLLTSRSLQTAVDSFLIFVEVAAAVGIVMLHRTSVSREARDYVVRTLMHWMLPALIFRIVWNIISTAFYDTPGASDRTLHDSESILLADWIVDDVLSVAIIATMIRLGTQNAHWTMPVIPGLEFGSPANGLDEEKGASGGEKGILAGGYNNSITPMSEM